MYQALIWLTIAPLLMLEGSGKELPKVLYMVSVPKFPREQRGMESKSREAKRSYPGTQEKLKYGRHHVSQR